VLRPVRSFRLSHQVKFSESFWKLRSSQSKSPAPFGPCPIDSEYRGPGMHRWIDVAEVPFVGGNLSSRMKVGLTQHQAELLFPKSASTRRKRQHMESKIPGGVPGILPFIRHRDDVGIVHVTPMLVARGSLARRQVGIAAPLLQPAVYVKIKVLFGPQHPGQGLPHHIRRIAPSEEGMTEA
jgi:hypothetical protein